MVCYCVCLLSSGSVRVVNLWLQFNWELSPTSFSTVIKQTVLDFGILATCVQLFPADYLQKNESSVLCYNV